MAERCTKFVVLLSYLYLRSEDDPFLLYAAMYSGQGTKFLTRDMMRDHSYCLGDSRLKVLFRKWQRGHHLELLQTAVGLQFKVSSKKNFLFVFRDIRAF